MARIVFVCVDMQYDFSHKGGPHYRPRKSVAFVKKKLVPFLRRKKWKCAEIISDYRQPRRKDTGNNCRPGEWGYQSEIPTNVLKGKQWIKCMNSPIWIRKNGGNPNKKPGYPYQDTKAFTRWLNKTIGSPSQVDLVVLFGLTLDCCVFCTAQELYFRGYDVRVLKEATDTYGGTNKEKEYLLNNHPLTNWMKKGPITFNELKQLF